MPKVTYLGPADNLYLEEGGEPIQPGDEVNIDDETLTALARGGHQFEEVTISDNTDRSTAEVYVDGKPISEETTPDTATTSSTKVVQQAAGQGARTAGTSSSTEEKKPS